MVGVMVGFRCILYSYLIEIYFTGHAGGRERGAPLQSFTRNSQP